MLTISSLFTEHASAVSLAVLGVVLIALFLVSHVYHKKVAYYNSNPYTLWWSLNYGRLGLEYQTINYLVYHNSVEAQLGHSLFTLDLIAWFMLSEYYLGQMATTLILFALMFQALSYTNQKLAFTIFVITCVCRKLASMTFDHFPEHIIATAATTIFVNGAIRSLSHMWERIPPLILHDTDLKFQMVAWSALRTLMAPKYAGVTIIGFFSEISAGLPGRLFPVQIYVWACQFFNANPTEWLFLTTTSESILAKGWTVHPLSNHLFSWVQKERTQ